MLIVVILLIGALMLFLAIGVGLALYRASKLASIEPAPGILADLRPARPLTHAKSPATFTESARTKHAISTLERIVNEGCGDAGKAWALAHGLLAMGPTFRTTEGASAIETIYAEIAIALVVDGKTLPLPAFRRDRFTEPHVDLVLKSVIEVGADPAQAISGRFGTGTLADHLRASMWRFEFSMESGPTSIEHPDDLPWSLQAFATWLRPDACKWRNQSGAEIDLHQVTAWAARRLQTEDQPLAERMASGRALIKDGKAIQAYTCGGAHFFQGVSFAVGCGYGGDEARAFVQEDLAIWLWRLDAELAAYDKEAQVQPPRVTPLELALQRQKFIGHWNESMHRALALGIGCGSDGSVPATTVAILERGLNELLDSIEALTALGAYEGLARRERATPAGLRDYELIVGDSAHALRGLKLALGLDGVWR